MMVTPEMLLFLAERMGLPDAYLQPLAGGRKRCVYEESWQSMRGVEQDLCEFNPATDDAQFGRLVAWAAWEGVTLLVTGTYVSAASEHRYSPRIEHDSTPDSIRAAAVVAIARALGWNGEA